MACYAVKGYERAEHLGAAGSEQGRDIIAWREGDLWAFQCKRVQSFTACYGDRRNKKVAELDCEELFPGTMSSSLPCLISL